MNVSSTVDKINSASVRSLRKMAVQYGVTMRQDGRVRTKEQLQSALIALIAPAPVVSVAPVAVEPVADKLVTAQDIKVVLAPVEGVRPAFPKKATSKQARFLAALRQGATADELEAIIGENKATLKQFIYYVCRSVGKSLGVTAWGDTYYLVAPEGF